MVDAISSVIQCWGTRESVTFAISSFSFLCHSVVPHQQKDEECKEEVAHPEKEYEQVEAATLGDTEPVEMLEYGFNLGKLLTRTCWSGNFSSVK